VSGSRGPRPIYGLLGVFAVVIGGIFLVQFTIAERPTSVVRVGPSFLVIVVGLVNLVAYRRRARRAQDRVPVTSEARSPPPGRFTSYAVPGCERAIFFLLLVSMCGVLAEAIHGLGLWALAFPGFIVWLYVYWIFWKVAWSLEVDGPVLRWHGLLRHGSVAIADIIRARPVTVPFGNILTGPRAIRFTVRGWSDITVMSYSGMAEFVVGLRHKAPWMEDWLQWPRR
jgi:hypothetical protein